ncbi:CMRF35-like molecule 2 [Rhinichthys klamathensis goyatoka]|uniref:CMRF35-like molecule 2 n=1 Tax=Rhinichthys klamathensis goyatoka TaxID=3034132 RepID=UPI0024B63460|nr:CMRF35-like molecule 2 [Rhinichthys klamathensis goyatoka]
MWNRILILWACIHISVVGAYSIMSGYIGERVDIRCSYESGYESNSKYFCKGECLLLNKNIMVKSGSPAKDERFSLTDDTTARVFTVTITDLRTEDQGQYWCAVGRSIITDVYSEILLLVKLDALAQTPLPQTSSPDTGSIGIIIAGVLFLLLICAVLFVLAVRKKKLTCGLAFFTARLHLPLRKVEENEYDKGGPTVLPNSNTAQRDNSSAANEIHRPANTEPADTNLFYINVADAATNSLSPDQIYTEMNASRQSHVYQCLTAESAKEESIYHTIVKKQTD